MRNNTQERPPSERPRKEMEKIADKYEQFMPVEDSFVRLDLEDDIARNLEGHSPVLIRGNPRIGKTSMTMSIAFHKYKREESLFLTPISQTKESLGDFRRYFGRAEVENFIAEIEMEDKKIDLKRRWKKENEIRSEIEKSGKTPFEYLNDYLSRKGKTALLSVDEVVGLRDQPQKLEHIADLRGLNNIRLLVVLHRTHQYEHLFKKIFNGFKTYFVRQLTLEETAELVRKPLKGTSVTVTDEAVSEIFEFTGGRPMEINNIMMAIFLVDSDYRAHKPEISAKDIKKITRAKVYDLKQDVFNVACRNYIGIFEDTMSEQEREIIRRLARKDFIPYSEVDADIIKPLIDTTFVIEDREAGGYHINGVLFKRVIANYMGEEK